MYPQRAVKWNAWEEDDLARFNEDLDRWPAGQWLNEFYLVGALERLDGLSSRNARAWWLTLARLNELALICAGNYADSGEFRSVGDLLFNPRRILVHIRNRVEPVLKERYTPLTEQFESRADSRNGVIDWLKRETRLEVREEPILPYLFRVLEGAGLGSPEYLRGVDERMKKIVEVTGLISACHLPPGVDIAQHLRRIPASERLFIESRLCRFGDRLFIELGRDAARVLRDPRAVSRFLLE